MIRKFLILLSVVSFNLPASGQEIQSDNAGLKDAFTLALQTVDINTRRGILAAGGDYGGEWTRDISINSWNGVSLFRPTVAAASLWSVTINKDSIGHQYWDKILWTISAYNHYNVTGDRVFLKQAYQCSVNTIRALEKSQQETTSGLFKGPSVFNDGIAGYPEPIYEPGNFSSSVLDHKNSSRIKCLSTNCVYYQAYVSLARMSSLLNEDKNISKQFQQKADDLKKNILHYFYDEAKNRLNYLVDQNGKVDESQEALGISFAVIFGIVTGDKATQLIHNAVVSRYGITSIYPEFPRYTGDKPGRHNNLIWPMVNGFFAQAAVASRNYVTFTNELTSLIHLALDADKGDYDFREIYNSQTGKPDGGYQANGKDHPDFHWESCRLQTWSATAYIAMVLKGVVGLTINEDAITLSPFLPAGTTFVQLSGLKYRQGTFDLIVKGKGNTIKKFTVDGKEQSSYSIKASTQGSHKVTIEVE